MTNEKILIVDDEAEVRSLISGVLADEGYNAILAANEQETISCVKKNSPDLIFLDLWIGQDESAGLKILDKLKKTHPEIPIVIISGHGTIDVALQAIRNGAIDFIEKPFVIERLLMTTKRALELYRLKKEVFNLKSGKLDMEIFSIGSSIFASSIRPTIEKVAPVNSRIFMQSPVGIEADTIAFWIHKKSQRKEYPFVYVNCSFDESGKLESELFGNEKNCGHIENANLGTLFLEEVTGLSKNCQRKLLQFLQEGSYSVGNKKIYANVRLICSSNENMNDMLEYDKFSKELYYRLNIMNINIPNLKDRREDISAIIEYYLENSEIFFGLKAKKFTSDALAILQSYDWPGNLRQIKNVIEASLINAIGRKEINKQLLPSELISSTNEKFDSLNISKLIALPIKEAKDCFESDYLRAQVIRFSGNISKTAAFIGMERSALHRKLKTLDIRYEKQYKNSKKTKSVPCFF
ncbi:MAG: sigma-54 dependent transcriptional regulator [Holosporaceae bacterium]|jgi:two-component system nitrogen regulation response regulator NtrX|nr:sigma-54 dependent transcriptional regulator [Holosporaceae bacterium]